MLLTVLPPPTPLFALAAYERSVSSQGRRDTAPGEVGMWRPPRGAWRDLLPGETATEFHDAEDEAEYHDSVALEEYTSVSIRKYVLALSRRDPREVRDISLTKLLWELPGLSGSTTSRKPGDRDVAEAIGTVARTVLIQCAGFKKVTANAASLERLLRSRDKDPLVVFLARLLDIPRISLSEDASAVLLSLIRSEGRVALRDCGTMDIGELTRFFLRVSTVLVAHAVKVTGSDGSVTAGGEEGKHQHTRHRTQGIFDVGESEYVKLSPHAYQQGFELLQIILELSMSLGQSHGSAKQ